VIEKCLRSFPRVREKTAQLYAHQYMFLKSRVQAGNRDQLSSFKSFPRVGLCFTLATRLRLSSRCKGGGVPIAARAIDLTALVAVNFFFFRFLGTKGFNHEGHKGSRRNLIDIDLNRAVTQNIFRNQFGITSWPFVCFVVNNREDGRA
jgi:hypothetical protein